MDTNQEVPLLPPPKPFISLPLAIVVVGVLISLSIVFSRGLGAGPAQVAAVAGGVVQTPQSQSIPVMPISSRDHIRGNPNAPLLIVEFSDTECPFCRVVHPTLVQLLAEQGDKVAWVYRHAPIAGLHKKSEQEGEATECAAELGGEEMFWKYLDELFARTPSNDGLDPALLPQIAEGLGLDGDKFSACLASGKYKERVESDLNAALAAGPGSTPWSVVMTRDGKTQFPISGALPINVWRLVIKAAMARITT